jgi:hypothetical protein
MRVDRGDNAAAGELPHRHSRGHDGEPDVRGIKQQQISQKLPVG